VNETRLRILGALVLAGTCLFAGVNSSRAQGKSGSTAGKIAGVVNDTDGIPQLGATVEIIAESTAAAPLDFLTNTQGVFRGERLAPGLYTVRVTLAGFLPTLEQHVRVSAHLTTVVRIQLESMFASLDQLRRAPSATTIEADDWKWVLRSASVTRPVLQWVEGDSSAGGSGASASISSPDAQIVAMRQPKAQLEFTDGAERPGSTSNIPSAPATAFAYDQRLGGTSRLLFAGQANYLDSSPGGGLATVWLPGGSIGTGPYTALVLREAKVGPNGPTFRGVHMEQGGSVGLGQRSKLVYSGEYVLVGLGKAATSLRPHVELDTQASDDWHMQLIFAEEPGYGTSLEPDALDSNSALAATLNELDSFPALLMRNGRPELEGGWHEEAAAERKIGSRGELQIAAFHDDNSHVAVYGRGSDMPAADYLPDYFSGAFAYDGGSLNSWGTRVALREKITEDLDLTTIYAFAGALSPYDIAVGEGPLRDMVRTSMHNSVGANVTVKVPKTGTKVSAGYKWVSGTAISRLDGYGETLYQMDPYLHIGIRQTLPRFAPGHWQAIADCDNILAQGYVSMNTQDGRTILVPAFRTFRGGLSVQF
jgi:Carboxypeptidase regulatory-like domain